MSSEMAVLPEPDSGLKLMYFSSKMQIYAEKVLQNLIRSFTIEECMTGF